jgi:threonine dehydrogenase-like Zn-dependent dehydrogenase
MRAVGLKERLVYREDWSEPVAQAGEALVRVSLGGICRTDLELVAGYKEYRGILGHELIGRVSQASAVWLDKRVVAEINVACGKCPWCRGGGDDRHCPHRTALGIRGRNGVFADYVTVPEANLRVVPDRVTDLQAVFCEPLAAAFAVLEALPSDGLDVLLCGDGNLGSLIAQVLKRRHRLVWVGRHAHKLALWKERGYDVRTTLDSAERFPIVVEATGNPEALSWAQSHLLPRGTLVLKSTTAAERHLDLNQLVVSEQRVVGSRCGRFEPALAALEEGSIDVESLLEATYPLQDGLLAFERAGTRGARKILLDCR